MATWIHQPDKALEHDVNNGESGEVGVVVLTKRVAQSWLSDASPCGNRTCLSPCATNQFCRYVH